MRTNEQTEKNKISTKYGSDCCFLFIDTNTDLFMLQMSLTQNSDLWHNLTGKWMIFAYEWSEGISQEKKNILKPRAYIIKKPSDVVCTKR